MYISTYHRHRAKRVHWEFNDHYWMVGIASPTRHRWWAVTVYLHFGRRPHTCK